MKADHFEILVEELSMEAFLTLVLPKILGSNSTFTIHSYRGKPDLLKKLGARLRGYAKWLPATSRIVVLVDRDDDDCKLLKQKMELLAGEAALATRSTTGGASWRLANRIAIEELEAWYFGNWDSVRLAYPSVPESVPNKAAYRACDAIKGGTWEALERILRRAGHFQGGLRKVEAASKIGSGFDPDSCTSPSFAALRYAVAEAVGETDQNH